MSLDSRLRGGLLDLGESFEVSVDESFAEVIRRGAAGLRSRRIVAAVLAVLALLGGLNASAIVGGIRDALEVDRFERSDPITTFPLRGLPIDLAAADGAIWAGVLRGKRSAVMRFDLETASSKELLRFKGRLLDVAVGEGSLWALVQGGGDRALLRIDPKKGAITKRQSVPLAHAITVGFGSAWMLAIDGDISRLDARSLKRTDGINAPGSVFRLEAGAGGVWLDTSNGPVMRIDPDAGVITERYPETHLESLGPSSAWLSRAGDGAVKDLIRVDIDSAQGTAWGGVPQRSVLAATEDKAWMLRSASGGDYEVVRLDEPGRLFATRTFVRRASLSSAQVVGDALIVLDRAGGSLIAIELTDL